MIAAVPAAATLGVVVPTIGDRPEIERLLRSALKQTRKVDHICVVVDAEDTRLVEEVVSRLVPEQGTTTMEVISTGARRAEGAYLVETGYGFAVNRGLERLDCDLYAFLDDDDEITPDHFAGLEAALDPGADRRLAYSRVMVLSPDGSTRLFQPGDMPEGRMRTAMLIGRHPVLLPASLIHGSLLEQVGHMDESLDRKADTDMVVRLCTATYVVPVDAVSYRYHRIAHGSVVLDRALTEMALLLRKHRKGMNRRERFVQWDSLCRASAQAGLPELSREAATEAVGVFWPRPPGFLVDTYMWLRGKLQRRKG